MKRIFTFFLAACMALGMAAQEHLKFMDIPIDGTIDQFQKKMEAKGLTFNEGMTRAAIDNTRVFQGVFFDSYSADYNVSFDESTKNVYRVYVSIFLPTRELREQAYNALKQTFIQQYGSGETGDNGEHESKGWTVKSAWGDVLGSIELYIFLHPDVYAVRVFYTDNENYIRFLGLE